MSRFRINKKDSIDIYIDSNKSEVLNTEKESLLKPSKILTGFYPRRLKRGGLIFYDMGRLANGDETFFIYQPSFSTFSDGSFTTTPLSVPDYSNRTNELFDLASNNPVNFESIFYKITQDDADYYRIAISDGVNNELLDSNNERWSNSGLSFSDDELADISIILSQWIYRWQINLFDIINLTKITTTFDFNGPDAENFSLKFSDKIFLLPALCFYTGECWWDFTDFEQHLNYDYRFGIRNYYNGNFTPAVDPTEFTITQPYTDVYQSAQLHKALSFARLYQREYNGVDYDWFSADPSTFAPNPPFTSTMHPTTGSYNLDPHITWADAREFEGVLIAVIQRSNSFYYVWTIYP